MGIIEKVSRAEACSTYSDDGAQKIKAIEGRRISNHPIFLRLTVWLVRGDGEK